MVGAGRPLGAVAGGAVLGGAAAGEGALGGRGQQRHGVGPGDAPAFGRRRSRTCAFGGRDEAAIGLDVAAAGGTLLVGGVGRRRGRALALAQHLTHLDAAAREDAGEDAGLERLALDAGQAGQQRGRSNEVATEPLAISAALLDDVQLVANLERQVGGRRGLEWVDAYCEGDARERPPARHGAVGRGYLRMRNGEGITGCGGRRGSPGETSGRVVTAVAVVAVVAARAQRRGAGERQARLDSAGESLERGGGGARRTQGEALAGARCQLGCVSWAWDW